MNNRAKEYLKIIKENRLEIQPFYNLNQLDDLADLIIETDPYIYPCFTKDKETLKKLLLVDGPLNYKNIIIAEHNGKLVGQITIFNNTNAYNIESKNKEIQHVIDNYFNTFTAENYENGYIIALSVLPEYRRCGVGRALMNYVVNRNLADTLDCLADNERALNLYDSFGFEKVGEEYIGYAFNEDDRPTVIQLRRKIS